MNATFMPEQWTWRCDRMIPSDTAAGRDILDEIIERLETEHWQQDDIFGVHLAVEEALVNAILHGNRLDSRKNIHVVCQLSPERIRVEIADQGNGFDPDSLPDPTCPERLHSPCGRGVMLMKAFMTRVEYNEQGNRVVLEKARSKNGTVEV
jgi:serine/threonine-protein kinase RsbW